MNAWVQTQMSWIGWRKPWSRLHLWKWKKNTWLKRRNSKAKMPTKTRLDGQVVWGPWLKSFLSRKFWYTSVCVGSNPSPVRTSFRRDEGNFPADEVPYTKKRVGLNANPFRQSFWNGWRQLCSRLDLWIQKFIKLKSRMLSQNFGRVPDRMAKRYNAQDSGISSVETSGTRVCARVRIPLLSEKVLNTMRQILQLTNSVLQQRQLKMTLQNKRKQKFATSSLAERSKSAQKRRYQPEICGTQMSAWVQTQISWNGWRKPWCRLNLWKWKKYLIEKAQLKSKNAD